MSQQNRHYYSTSISQVKFDSNICHENGQETLSYNASQLISAPNLCKISLQQPMGDVPALSVPDRSTPLTLAFLKSENDYSTFKHCYIGVISLES